jgi:serine/threonine protein phosphatase PrpC
LLFTSETYTSAAGSCNEDIGGCVSNAAWILDGATSLSRRTVPASNGQHISDAAHFVATLSAEFHRGIGNGQDIARALDSSLRSVRQDADIRRFLEEDFDVPSASFAAVQLMGPCLQVANLGDCTILLQADNGTITSFGDSAVRQLDAALLSSYLALRRKVSDRGAVREALAPLIRENRARMNTPGGYWILEPRGHGLSGLQQMAIRFSTEVRGLLVTDGLYRIVDTYHLMRMEEFFEEAFSASGLERLVSHTRDAETLDSNETRWPRVKARDDATIVKFEIQ